MARTSLVGIEVHTRALNVMLMGFELFPSFGAKFLLSQNVASRGPDGQLVIDEDRWIPLDPWLSAIETVHREIGPNAVFVVGKRVFEARRFPSWVKDVESALRSIDEAYHQSHRRSGVVMFDPKTSRMLEGIGHFRVRQRASLLEVQSDTPYPCDVDFGIVTGVAQRMDPKARVSHDPAGCRTTGASECVYGVTL